MYCCTINQMPETDISVCSGWKHIHPEFTSVSGSGMHFLVTLKLGKGPESQTYSPIVKKHCNSQTIVKNNAQFLFPISFSPSNFFSLHSLSYITVLCSYYPPILQFLLFPFTYVPPPWWNSLAVPWLLLPLSPLTLLLKLKIEIKSRQRIISLSIMLQHQEPAKVKIS